MLSQQELTSLENLTISFDSLWVAPEKRRSLLILYNDKASSLLTPMTLGAFRVSAMIFAKLYEPESAYQARHRYHFCKQHASLLQVGIAFLNFLYPSTALLKGSK